MKLLLATCLAVTTVDATAAGIRVLTYNIHHAEGSDGIVDLERIAAIIREQSPDVVCLQEVDKRLPRTGLIDMPAHLGKMLNMNTAYGPNYFFDNGEYGNCTLSPHAIVAEENIPLPTPAGVEPRGCLKTQIQIGESVVTVFNTHFGLTGAQRRSQADALSKHLTGENIIVAGDLNETAEQPGVAHLVSTLIDTISANSDSTSVPKRRIDYILASRVWDVVSSRFILSDATKVASDHLPYLAVLARSAKPDRFQIDGEYGKGGDQLNDVLKEEPNSWQQRSTGSP